MGKTFINRVQDEEIARLQEGYRLLFISCPRHINTLTHAKSLYQGSQVLALRPFADDYETDILALRDSFNQLIDLLPGNQPSHGNGSKRCCQWKVCRRPTT